MKVNKSHQIVTYIKWRINSGIYKPNKKIPSEAALANTFGCARATVRKALQELKDEGYIVSRKAIGYFVSLSKQKLTITPKSGDSSFTKFQLVPTLDLTEQQVEGFDKLEISWKAVEEDFKNKFIKTYCTEEGKPFTVIQSALNSNVIDFMDNELVAKSLSAFLSKFGVKIAKRREFALMTIPDQHIRIKLNTKLSEYVPTVYSVMEDIEGNIVELAIQYWLPHEFEMEKTIIY